MTAVQYEQETQRTNWTSRTFVQSYRILDEEWLTKTALYDETIELLRQVTTRTNPLHVLDIGGGMGTLANRAFKIIGNEQFASWTVYDRAEGMMQGGTTYAQRLHGVNFMQGDLTAPLPFADHSLDAIIAINVMYLFDDMQHIHTIAPEVSRVLKDGGILLVLNPIENPNMSRLITTEVRMRAEKHRQTVIRARMEVIRELFANLNFLREQRQLEANANKKAPEDWTRMYQQASQGRLRAIHTGLSKAYAEQAGTFVLTAD